MDLATLRAEDCRLSPVLTERSRRVWAATEGHAIGYGGMRVAGDRLPIRKSARVAHKGFRGQCGDGPDAGMGHE